MNPVRLNRRSLWGRIGQARRCWRVWRGHGLPVGFRLRMLWVLVRG